MKLDIKNILESYFKDGEGENCPVCVEHEGERSPLFSIASFIDQHKLSLTRRNCELAWEFVCGGNSLLKNEVMGLSAAARLNNGAADDLYDKYLNGNIGTEID
jgi:hypothetical protein